MAITIERLEKMEAAGTLTHDLRVELSRMRKERDLERQLAEAEAAAKAAPKRPAPVALPEEPQAADDVLIVAVNRVPMGAAIIQTVGDQDYVWNGRSTCFVPRKLWDAELFKRRFSWQLDDMFVIHEDWHGKLLDPRRLVSATRAAEQEIAHLIDNVRSPLIAHLWQSSLKADNQRTRKLDDLLAREGIVRPEPLTGSDAWEIIVAKRAADEKAKAEALEKRRKQAEQQRKHMEIGMREETARIAAKRAAQEAYRKALDDIANPTKTTSTRRKTA